MNNILQDKISVGGLMFEKIFSSEKIVNPSRNWNILMILFSVIILASIFFDYFMYRQIVNGDMYVSVNRQDLVIENLKTKDLQRIVDNFDAKKAKITGLKLENQVDPSI